MDYTPPPYAATSLEGTFADTLVTILSNPLVIFVLYLVFAVFVFYFILQIIRLVLRRLARKGYTFKRVVYLVTVPKESEEEAEKKEAIQKKDIKEFIAGMEDLYANIIAKRPRTFTYYLHKIRYYLFGKHGHLSLEIVAHEGLIKFYVVTPKHLAEYVEQQIHAQFSTANVEETEDYNIFEPDSFVMGTYLRLTRSQILPLRTYKKLDADPLESITNNLSKLKEDEGAAIQIILRHAPEKWRERGLKITKVLHKGKTLEEALTGEMSWKKVLGNTIGLPFKLVKLIFKEFFKKPEEAAKEAEEAKAEKSPPSRLLKREEELMQSMEEMFSKPVFECNIRLVASSKTQEKTESIMRGLIGTFGQFASTQTNNKFKNLVIYFKSVFMQDFIKRNFREWKKLILSTEELTSLYHFPLPFSETPNILWLTARNAPPPVELPDEGIVLGKSVYRGIERMVKIKRDDRRRHVYIIGKSGVGKSVLLANMAIQDIQNGEGVCVVDPHGDLIEDILIHIPKERADDVVVFDPSDTDRPMGLNMLEVKNEEEKDFAVQEMIAIFYKLFPPEMIGPMFEHNMRNVMLTLMEDQEYPGTVADIPRMFTDTEFQNYKVKKVKDPIVRAFWEKEMAKTSDFHKSEMLGYLISKVGRFVENTMMRNIIGQPKSGFDFRDIMDNQKILLVNLAKGRVGEVNSNLLGLIIVSKLQMAAMARAALPREQRKDFYLYIDEFQNFITDSVATILSEARKYMLDLIIAHQYMGQLVGEKGDTKIRDAVLGNAGTMISFKIGVEDAETMAKEFAPVFNEYDVINVEKYNAYIKLLVDNQASRPFNMQTIPPIPGNKELADKIKELSRLKHGRERSLVEADILERTKLGEAVSKAVEGGAEPTL